MTMCTWESTEYSVSVFYMYIQVCGSSSDVTFGVCVS